MRIKFNNKNKIFKNIISKISKKQLIVKNKISMI